MLQFHPVRTSSSPLWLCALVLACGCKPSSPLGGFHPPADTVLLPIPDRPWAPEAPEEGWCGEASIQMTALHFGAWVPQARVHQLGKPAHVDLWEDDVPIALDGIGLAFERYSGKPGDLAAFFGWIVGQVRRGHPVIVGAKIFPTEHPDWDVDHLLVVVGYSPTELVFDTNMDGQVRLPYPSLAQRGDLSFVSPSGRYYGFAVRGFATAAAPPTELQVTGESDAGVALTVTARGLTPGRRYQLWRDNLLGGRWSEDWVADGGEASFAETEHGDAAARYFVTEAPAAAGGGGPRGSVSPAPGSR